MRWLRWMGVLAAFTNCACAALPLRDGWSFVPGAHDLIRSGSWGCLSQVSASEGAITISAGTGFNTVINTTGPLLQVQGDFSILATLATPSSGGTYLTLVGTLNTGEWWSGLKRLDVGVAGGVQVNYWTGSSSSAVAQTLTLPPSAGDLVNLEVARIGNQFVVFVNGVETGRVADPGIFASGRVYLGFNVAPGSRLTVQALAAAQPSDSARKASLAAPYLQVAERTGTALRDVAERRGFLVGAAVNPTLFAETGYAPTLGREFNLVVAENAMKFAATQPARGRFSFCQGDQIVAFAESNGMKVRGHTLVWQQSLPNWLTSGGFSNAEAAAILQEHIAAVIGHFKGKVPEWDVVNEAIAYGAPYGMQPSYWLDKLGPNYVDMAFRWAHQADPGARLFYNETGAEALGTKSDVVYNLLQGMLSRGVPVHGVGLQMHVDAARAPSVDSISANIKRLGALGLEVRITEMDVRIPASSSAADLAAQAAAYRNIAAACVANANCTAIVTWGVSDAHSWIPGSYPGFGAALLFDAQYRAKPAHTALVELLAPAAGSVKPEIANGGVVIHGGVAREVSPGSLVDIYGQNLAAATATAAVPLPLKLAGAQVLVNGTASPLVYASPTQIIFQVPYATPIGEAAVVVSVDGAPSAAAPMTVQQAAPSILTYGNNRAVVQHSDYSINSSANCVRQGSYAVVYLIGSGPLTNTIPTGAVAPAEPLAMEVLPTAVTIGGAAGPVIFAGMTPGFAGLMQVNFQIPSGAPGDLAMQVSIGGAASNQALICVSR